MLGLLLKHSKLILLWGLVTALLVGLVSFIVPIRYSAESQVLIISRDRSGVDPYTQSKAAERVGENLAEIMRTTDFYNKVMESNSAGFDKERWQGWSARKQRKQWKQSVVGQVEYGTSLLKVTAYSFSKDDTSALANAVLDVLSSRGWEYIGGDVTIRVVNTPLVSRLPARPNFILNIMLGFLIGVVAAGGYVGKYRKHLFGLV